ncbi:MAG: hypothetical protein ACXVKA_09170 [Acidimicrobiia bacterium]
MLFEARFRDGVHDGSVTVTFRRWKRCQAVAGHRYRTAVGIIEVESVDVVDASKITNADARRSGYPSAAAVIGDLRGTEDLPIYRVRFHAVHGPDPRDELAATAALTDDEVAELDRRLTRLDNASSSGPWTRATLAIIDEHPAVRAGDLATHLGRDRDPFKLDVRKLKNLGLTLSLDVGYHLSPRGREYLKRTKRAEPE